jgi:putative tricarboxylic transport membrane protein
MWVGNAMLVILNLPLIGIWIKLLTVPYRLLYPAILSFCCIGIYSVANSPIDVFMTAAFGLFGYTLLKFGLEPAPLLLGFVLGRLMEEKLRQALVISRGHMTTFVDCQLWLGKCDRPISTGLLVLALLIVIVAVLPSISKSRDEVFQDAD